MTSEQPKKFKGWAELFVEKDQYGNHVAWHVRYQVVANKGYFVRLDAKTLADALFEASELTGIPKEEILA